MCSLLAKEDVYGRIILLYERVVCKVGLYCWMIEVYNYGTIILLYGNVFYTVRLN